MPGIADGGTWQSVNLVPGEVAGYIAPDVILRAADEPRNRASTAAGEDIRILAVEPGERPADLPRWDYRLFDSRDLWAMHYAWRPARYAQCVAESWPVSWRKAPVAKNLGERGHIWRGFGIYLLLGVAGQAARAGGK